MGVIPSRLLHSKELGKVCLTLLPWFLVSSGKKKKISTSQCNIKWPPYLQDKGNRLVNRENGLRVGDKMGKKLLQ